MLVEPALVEQRYKAVLEVLDGADVVDVARRYGVARQTVHTWLRNYAARGLAGLVDGSSRPLSCPHRMSPEVEARIVELRREHLGRSRHRCPRRAPLLNDVYRWARGRRWTRRNPLAGVALRDILR